MKDVSLQLANFLGTEYCLILCGETLAAFQHSGTMRRKLLANTEEQSSRQETTIMPTTSVPLHLTTAASHLFIERTCEEAHTTDILEV